MKYLISFSLLILLASCGSKQEFIHPTTEKISESVYASGYLKSKDQYQVYAKTTGILQQVWVKKGDEVKKGQVLFTLSNEVSKLNVDNAQLTANNATIDNNADKLSELALTIDMSKKKLENDQLIVERQRKLWSEQIGTKFELEQKELAYSNSKAAYQSAQLRYNELKKQLNFNAAQSKKSLAINKSLLSDYRIMSEVNGRVYSILKEKGELVSPQQSIAIIGDAAHYTLMLNVDENDIVKINQGQHLYVSMDSYKGQVFEAVVDRINPLMNERTRSFEVEASFVKQPATLYPNLTLEANIILQSKENALTIPRNYLIDDEYVLISPKEKKKIKIGMKDYQKVEILEGLSKEDKLYLPK